MSAQTEDDSRRPAKRAAPLYGPQVAARQASCCLTSSEEASFLRDTGQSLEISEHIPMEDEQVGS